MQGDDHGGRSESYYYHSSLALLGYDLQDQHRRGDIREIAEGDQLNRQYQPRVMAVLAHPMPGISRGLL